MSPRLKGKRAVRSFARKLAEPETIRELNITPMMDMMTIILVFLLKNFTSSDMLLPPDIALAPSITQQTMKQAVQVLVTKRVLLVEGEAIASISNGKIDPSQKRDGENGYYITNLVDTLQKHANRERRIAELGKGQFEAELMVVADRTTPYRLLNEVLYSCGQAGYQNYRLTVLKTRE